MTKQDRMLSHKDTQTFFCVTHSIDRGHRKDRKGVGTYSERSKAIAAIDSVRTKPGFRNAISGFQISECQIGMMYLPHGYDRATEVPRLVNGVELRAYGDVVWEVSAVSLLDEEQFDDDFVLIGLFATLADAHLALHPIRRLIDEAKHRLEVHENYVDRVEWTEGFGTD
jgi:hypothetical protein